FQAEDGIRYRTVTGVQTCALPILDCHPESRSEEHHVGWTRLPAGAQTGCMRRVVLGVALALLAAGVTAPVGASAPVRPPHFSPSGFVASSRRFAGESPGASTSVTSAPDARRFASTATIATSTLSHGSNINVVAGSDVKQLGTINGVNVQTCNANKQTAQNETTIAVNPSNGSYLVAGVNDYRLYEPTER